MATSSVPDVDLTQNKIRGSSMFLLFSWRERERGEQSFSPPLVHDGPGELITP